MNNIFKVLEEALLIDERLVAEGKLLKNKAIELALKMDARLLRSLLKNETLSAFFFVDIDGIKVFDKIKFQWAINNKSFLPDSYTAFKNKIGLTNAKGEYFSESSDVVLVWPYKDCVLEGGQTKEDQKREEIFWNETLAPDEIDRLLYPKVLTRFKKYTIDGEQCVGDEVDFSKENLIIRGNNLLALSSLRKRFAGKVKLIYIDPPYNTGTDSFGYNDRFKHSSWLTFMKNRLEIAKDLLSNDGFIFVQCDDNENAYLKILMDSLFGEENYRNSIYWHRTYAGKTVSKNLPWNVDTILLYSKNPKTNLNAVTSELTEKDMKSFNKDDNDGRGPYTTVSLQKTGNPGPKTTYDYIDNNGRIWPCPVKGWRMTKEKLKALENDNRLYITDSTIREKYYLKERLKIGKQIDNFWSDIGNMNRNSDTNYNLNGQKPEKLIERIINMATLEGDIVMDFFLGSGTTAAVAHKLGRQYIGIEQLDYGENDCIVRLQRVINGEQTGISKSVGWQGGGSFIYCELKKLNQLFIEKIQAAADDKELADIWEQMKKKAHLSYKVDIKAVDANADDFAALSFEDKQRFLIEVLDKNMLYVNYCDIDDADYNISDEDKRLNNLFYGRG